MSAIPQSSGRDEPPYPLHPSVIDRLDPEYADFYNKHIYDKQQVHLQPIAVSRTGGTLIPGAGPTLEVAKQADYTIARTESTGPDILIRAFTPMGEKPAGGWPLCFWFHGGGWVLGNIDTETVISTNLCARAKSVVIAVDYRLAPESVFPAAVDDCWEAVLWATSKGQETLDINPAKLAVAGSSAGGNLAAVMCQRAAARNGPKMSLQLLSVPVADNTADTANNPSWKDNELTPALSAAKMNWYKNHYLPNKSDWAHPEASPLLWEGDWAKLPPAVIVVGELDVLCAEGQQFGEKLRKAGVKAVVRVMRGQPHPFIAMDGVLQAGRDAITDFCDALKETMYP